MIWSDIMVKKQPEGIGGRRNYETRLAAREAFQQMIAVGNRRSGASLLNLDACIVNRESRNV